MKPAITAALAAWLMASTAVYAAPPIRTSEANRVPACVSPDRLMDFLKTRNPNVDPKYRDIARWYRHWGEAWHVRWDYAFFQMAIETNYLKYRRGDGRRGDVHEKQNNFAGIGATGGGVAGERFQDVKTGVHAQIQHLVAYSGERVADPVARRTDENQDDIIAKSRRLGRQVTFGDLARRWAADRQYAKSIDFIASEFRTSHCKGPATADNVPVPQPAKRPVRTLVQPAGLGGPKPQKQEPQKLAGPEALPWTDGGPVAADGTLSDSDLATPPAKKPSPDQPRRAAPQSPVKTLWSRTKPAEGEPRAAEPPHAPKAAPAPVEAAPARAAPAERQVQIEPPDVPATAPAEPALVTETAAAPAPLPVETSDAEPAPMPHFRIAPLRPEPTRPEPSHLGGPVDAVAPAPAPAAERRDATAQPAPEGRCRLLSASYGGKKTLLVRTNKDGDVQLTALTVLDGFERSMLDTYAKSAPAGVELVGTYQSKDEALAEGQRLCPPHSG